MTTNLQKRNKTANKIDSKENSNDNKNSVPCDFRTPTKRKRAIIVSRGGCDSPPAHFPCQRTGSNASPISNKRLRRIVPSTQSLPMLPSSFGEECDSQVLIKLAPRFKRERIMDMLRHQIVYLPTKAIGSLL